MEETDPDVAILCSATENHANGVEQTTGYGVHVFLEKPFAASLADAD